MRPAPTRLAVLLSAAGLGMSMPGAAMAQADPFERLLSVLTSGAQQSNDLACQVAEYGALIPCRPAPAAAPAAASPVVGAAVAGSSRAAASLEPSPPDAVVHRQLPSSKGKAPAARISTRQNEAVALRPPANRRSPIPTADGSGQSAPTQGIQDDERRAGGAGLLGQEIQAVPIAPTAPSAPKVPEAPAPFILSAAPAVPLRVPSLQSVVFEEVPSPQPHATSAMQPVLGRPPRQPDGVEASPSAALSDVAVVEAPDAIAFGEERVGQVASAPPQLATSVDRDGEKATAVPSTATTEQHAALPAKDVTQEQFPDDSTAPTGYSKSTTLSARASIDSGLSSVAGVNGANLAQPDGRSVATKAEATMSAWHVTAGLAPPTPSVATGAKPADIDPLSASDDVVVGTHRDRVMMSLAAVLAGDDLDSGRLGAPPGRTVVASQREKVLATLANVRNARSPTPAHTTRSSVADAVDDTGMAEWGASVVPSVPRNAARWAAADPTDLVEQGVETADAATMPAGAARRTQPTSPHNPIGDQVVALGADRLDDVRGGFTTPEGLKVSFGIERAVYLNGDLVTTTSLNVSELSKISGGRAQVSTTGPESLALVQSGLGNAFQPGTISQTAAGTVIQNTLDNQKIQTITRIDAVVNSSSIIRSMNLQSSMRSAVVDSLRR
jgi:hypothetical protein